MRSWLPISGMHMMDELKGNPETARTYPLLLRAFEREADLITVSRTVGLQPRGVGVKQAEVGSKWVKTM